MDYQTADWHTDDGDLEQGTHNAAHNARTCSMEGMALTGGDRARSRTVGAHAVFEHRSRCMHPALSSCQTQRSVAWDDRTDTAPLTFAFQLHSACNLMPSGKEQPV